MLDLMRKEANGYCLWRDKEKNRKSQREAPTLEILDCCAEFDCVRMCDGCFRRMHSVLNFPAVELCFPFFPFPSWCFVSCVSCGLQKIALVQSFWGQERLSPLSSPWIQPIQHQLIWARYILCEIEIEPDNLPSMMIVKVSKNCQPKFTVE